MGKFYSVILDALKITILLSWEMIYTDGKMNMSQQYVLQLYSDVYLRPRIYFYYVASATLIPKTRLFCLKWI